MISREEFEKLSSKDKEKLINHLKEQNLFGRNNRLQFESLEFEKINNKKMTSIYIILLPLLCITAIFLWWG